MAKHLVITRAEKGSRVCTGGLQPEFEVPVRKREIGDPAGCGDAFLAALVYSLSSGEGFEKACLTASAAGALAFDMLGVACPTLEQIEAELKHPEYREVRKHGHT
jgi:adenosine kinase